MATPDGSLFSDALKGFVKAKKDEGCEWLDTFKNRSGQQLFAIYDPELGHPTTHTAAFLCSFLSLLGKTGGGIVLPVGDLEMKSLYPDKIIQVLIDESTDTVESFKAKLAKAFDLLVAELPASAKRKEAA